MTLDEAREGKRYRVTWEADPNDGGPEGSFTAVLLLKTYTPGLFADELFLDSVTWDNGVTTGGYSYEAEEVASERTERRRQFRASLRGGTGSTDG